MAKRDKNIIPKQPDDFHRVLEHLPLPGPGDLTSMVVKGHLLIEEQLRLLLDELVVEPPAISAAKLRFAQVLYVVKALVFVPGQDWLWESLTLLNNIRNKMAHKLEAPELHTLLERFVDVLEHSPTYGEIPDRGFPDRLWSALTHLHGALAGIRGARRESA